MSVVVLVRYGAMGEVARFWSTSEEVKEGVSVVVRSSRGEELGIVIGKTSASGDDEKAPPVVRIATADDCELARKRRSESESEFPQWQSRIVEWNLDLELVDIERSLDGEKIILYVLNDRGPETTKLALRAAAAGFGVIEVQPVGPEGLIVTTSGGGCGSGGCRK